MDNPEKDFITERVLDQEGNRRKTKSVLLKAAALIVGAVIFGVLASLTFVLTKPVFESMTAEKESKPQEQVVIPQDEPETAPTNGNTEENSGALQGGEENETGENIEDNIEEIVESAVQSREWTMSDYLGLHSSLIDVMTNATRGIVTVSVSTSDTDLFENQIASVGSTAGAIWNINEEYLFILTMVQEGIESGALEITFRSGVTSPAELRGIDHTCGLAVVCVPLDKVDALTRSSINAIPLGNSLMVQRGDPVLFVGNPRQYVGSVDVGMVSYLRTGIAGIDMEYRALGTDLSTDEKSGGFVLDTSGSMIGVILKGQTGLSTEAIGISDLKGILERLANKKKVAYMGITGLEVTDAISKAKDIPLGIYISDLQRDGPAFKAGLQTGDILTRVGKEEVLNVQTLEKCLLNLSPGTPISVTAMRVDRNIYSEQTFTVSLGER